MIQYSSNYEVAPCSRLDLRNYAKQLRQTLGIDTPYFPICQLLEVLPNFGIQYDYIDDATWDFVYGKDNHARYDLTTKTISVKESVYERALQNHGRDRYTIAHEIAHALLLDGNNITLNRASTDKQSKLYTNPEWQADCLAGELLMPQHLCKNMSVEEIIVSCAVSYEAANYQKRKF